MSLPRSAATVAVLASSVANVPFGARLAAALEAVALSFDSDAERAERAVRGVGSAVGEVGAEKVASRRATPASNTTPTVPTHRLRRLGREACGALPAWGGSWVGSLLLI
ncbi:MAG: hypothetical protein ACYCVV_06945 [Acidimicrobiales bacterium]